jgi:ribosomal protein S18 acetylase RimI-like enzyme
VAARAGLIGALTGRDPADVQAEMDALPDGVAWVISEDGRAAGIRVDRTDPPGLMRVHAVDGPAIAPLVADLRAAHPGRRVHVGLRRAPGAAEWLAARGWRLVDRFLVLRRADFAAVPPLPPDVVERGLDDVGIAAYLALDAETFTGVPGHAPWNPDDFARMARDPGFDRDLVRILVDAQGPVGFVYASRPQTVEAIGVRTRARGRGLGRFLLRRGEALLRDRGATATDLLVAESNRRALTLYLAEGYREVERRDVWALTG